MACALRACAIKEGKNSVHNLQYGPRTRLIRGISFRFSLQKSLLTKSFPVSGIPVVKQEEDEEDEEG